jgi:hypothetical protein
MLCGRQRVECHQPHEIGQDLEAVDCGSLLLQGLLVCVKHLPRGMHVARPADLLLLLVLRQQLLLHGCAVDAAWEHLMLLLDQIPQALQNSDLVGCEVQLVGEPLAKAWTMLELEWLACSSTAAQQHHKTQNPDQ